MPKQPRKSASSLGEFASSFADELGSLAGAVKRGTKTAYSNAEGAQASLDEQKRLERERKKRRPAY